MALSSAAAALLASIAPFGSITVDHGKELAVLELQREGLITLSYTGPCWHLRGFTLGLSADGLELVYALEDEGMLDMPIAA